MKKIYFLLLVCLVTQLSFAQTKNEQQAIKNLCGCYEVTFKYAETFAADTAYKFSPKYNAVGLEWVVAEEASDKKFVLQHLLLADSMVIKHWREDWEFEQTNWWLYNHDASWKLATGNKEKVKGQWTQTVWGVDDEPRYQGSSAWVNSNGKYYWENTTDSPLPRREYSKRNDYNVMNRTNRIIMTDTGWVHEQDNKKIIRKDGIADKYLAEEKGFNIYRKTSDAKCQQATAYWEKHKQFWANVRQSWEELLKGKSAIQLTAKAENKYLYQQLDEVEKQTLTAVQQKEKIKAVLGKFIAKGDAGGVATK
jgi:hypothetical protein